MSLSFKILSGLYLRNVKNRKLIFGRDIGWGCSYATSRCDLHLTLDHTGVALCLKIISGLYLRKCKVLEVDTCRDIGLGVLMCNIMV